MPLVQLKLGDMFDGPSDLIVLPCSTAGTITEFVRVRLVHHRIPSPSPGMQLGDVTVIPFDGGESIAQYVAFAASVKGNSTTTKAIFHIGEQLGDATTEHSSIRRVSAPLLGAGAGGLRSETVVEALSSGFKSTAHRDALLLIHVLHKEVFERLSPRKISPSKEDSGKPVQLQGQSSSPVRVFISYSHTSPDHERWVEQLGAFLRENGIDARLDVWHLRHGMD